MTAAAYAVTVKDSTVFSLDKKLGAKYKLDDTIVTLLGLVTTSDDVGVVLQFINDLVERKRAVDVNTIGLATNVQVTTGPTNISLSAATLANGADGSVTPVTVGTLSVTAPITTSYTYSKVAGTGDTNNANYSISGTTLRYIGAAASGPGTQSVRIRVTDLSGYTYDKAFTITISA